MKSLFLTTLAILSVVTPSTAQVNPQPYGWNRVDYLSASMPSDVPSTIHDDWPNEAMPIADPRGDRDGDFEADGLLVQLRGARRGSEWSDLHVRFVTLQNPYAGVAYLALYRRNDRIERWEFHPLGNSYVDSLSLRYEGGKLGCEILGALESPDSSLRLTFRTRVRIDPDRGNLHQFVLVFRPELDGYRLSHAEESFDIRYDARRGTVIGAGEMRVQGEGEPVLERRRILSRSKSNCNVDDLAQRLAQRTTPGAVATNAVECLRRSGSLLSRRLESAPSELYDVATK